MFVFRLLEGDAKRLQAGATLFRMGSQSKAKGTAMIKQGRETFSSGYLAIFATVVIWSTPSLFQFYLIRYYEPWSQNFYRYLVGFLAVLPFVLLRFRGGGPRLNPQVFLACL